MQLLDGHSKIESTVRYLGIEVDDAIEIAENGYALDRATVRQNKTGRPVRFELTDQTRHALDEYLRLTGLKPGELLFPGRRDASRGMTTRHYARMVREWVASIGLDPGKFGTHSLRDVGNLWRRDVRGFRLIATMRLTSGTTSSSVIANRAKLGTDVAALANLMTPRRRASAKPKPKQKRRKRSDDELF